MKTRLILLSFLAALPASAVTVLIDFGPNSTSTGNWNNFTGTTVGSSLSGLIDTTGTATSYALTHTGTSTINTLGDNTTSTILPVTASPFNVTSVISDSFYYSSAQSFTLSGLNPTLTYNLTFYAYVTRTGSRLTTYTVNGNSVSIEPANSNLGGTGGTATLSGLVPDSSGNLVINIALGSGNTGNWILNGLAVTSVPEPAASLLGALGLIPLLRRRR